MPSQPRLTMRLIKTLDAISVYTGRAIAWLTLAMVLVTCLIVVLRYLFALGWIWMQESVVWMHALVFLIGAAYTLQKDEHVRVDVFYRDMTHRRRALVNAVGSVIFLLPFCAFILWSSWDYIVASWRISESSREAGGLPYPFMPLLKTSMFVTAALVGLQGLSQLMQSVLIVTGRLGEGGEAPGGQSEL